MWCIINDEPSQREIDVAEAKQLTCEIDVIIDQLEHDDNLPIEKVRELCSQVTNKADEVDKILSKYL